MQERVAGNIHVAMRIKKRGEEVVSEVGRVWEVTKGRKVRKYLKRNLNEEDV